MMENPDSCINENCWKMRWESVEGSQVCFPLTEDNILRLQPVRTLTMSNSVETFVLPQFLQLQRKRGGSGWPENKLCQIIGRGTSLDYSRYYV